MATATPRPHQGERPPAAGTAAALSAPIGLLGLALGNIASEAYPKARAALAWMAAPLPGGAELGAYLGLEAFGLLAWLASWLVLHAAVRQARGNGAALPLLVVAGTGIAILLVWPPVAHLVLRLI